MKGQARPAQQPSRLFRLVVAQDGHLVLVGVVLLAILHVRVLDCQPYEQHHDDQHQGGEQEELVCLSSTRYEE